MVEWLIQSRSAKATYKSNIRKFYISKNVFKYLLLLYYQFAKASFCVGTTTSRKCSPLLQLSAKSKANQWWKLQQHGQIIIQQSLITEHMFLRWYTYFTSLHNGIFVTNCAVYVILFLHMITTFLMVFIQTTMRGANISVVMRVYEKFIPSKFPYFFFN